MEKIRVRYPKLQEIRKKDRIVEKEYKIKIFVYEFNQFGKNNSPIFDIYPNRSAKGGCRTGDKNFRSLFTNLINSEKIRN